MTVDIFYMNKHQDSNLESSFVVDCKSVCLTAGNFPSSPVQHDSSLHHRSLWSELTVRTIFTVFFAVYYTKVTLSPKYFQLTVKFTSTRSTLEFNSLYIMTSSISLDADWSIVTQLPTVQLPHAVNMYIVQ